jgi:hypothetical protein
MCERKEGKYEEVRRGVARRGVTSGERRTGGATSAGRLPAPRVFSLLEIKANYEPK